MTERLPMSPMQMETLKKLTRLMAEAEVEKIMRDANQQGPVEKRLKWKR